MSEKHLSAQATERFDDLPRNERESALRHLETCPECRTAFLAPDPTRVFRLLGLAAVPREVLDQVSAGVSRSIDAGRPRDRHWEKIAAWAAAAVLAAALFLVPERQGLGERAQGPPPRTGAAASDLRLLSSAGQAQVVELALGDVQVMMIFDEELDL